MPPINIRLKKIFNFRLFDEKKIICSFFLPNWRINIRPDIIFFFQISFILTEKKYFFKKLKCIHISFFQSLHLKLEPDQAYAQHWNIINGQSEMIQILERFFDSRVAIPPFRLNAVHAFCKILQSPIEALKDIINILR